MTETLVPDVAASISPTVCDKNWMNGCPADLRVPEPQGRLRCGMLCPSLDMWSVPLTERIRCGCVTRETIDSVRAIGDYADRPWLVHVTGLCETEFYGYVASHKLAAD